MQKLLAIVIFCLTASYCLIRYYILGDVVAQNIPVYLLNKTLAFSSILYFLCLLIAKSKICEASTIGFWGKTMFHTTMLHCIFSIMLLSPLYYHHLYDWQKMNWYGELSTLFGVLGSYLLCIQLKFENFRKLPWKTFNILLTFLFSSHILCIGYDSWIHPERWHGNLFPISLISFIIASHSFLWSLVLYFKQRNL